MKYIVGADGSAVSDNAVELAAVHASELGAALEIVHVLTPETEIVDGRVVLPGEAAAIEQGERTLEGAERVAAAAVDGHDEPPEITTELLAGRPADAITEHADAEDADAIYVGHRGLSDRPPHVVGSVAKTVVDRTTVPVTIVR